MYVLLEEDNRFEHNRTEKITLREIIERRNRIQ